MRSHALALCAASLFFFASAVLPISVQAQSSSPAAQGGLASPIGKVLTVTGAVTIEHATAVVVQASLPSGASQAKVGDLVYQGDIVQTGADGKVGLTFTDGTAFNLSNNARMVLDEFVYDPKGASNSTLFSLTKGTFTFVAGQVAKTGDMKFDTPVATMGIRGTTPHVEISDDGTVRFSTLIEEKPTTAAAPGPTQQQRRATPARQRRAAAPVTLSAEQTEKYNRLLNYEFKICRGC
jgi:hypothetical protein